MSHRWQAIQSTDPMDATQSHSPLYLKGKKVLASGKLTMQGWRCIQGLNERAIVGTSCWSISCLALSQWRT
ncbi:unnamed protein product [Penicillium roqueforti FM164]|uniref:Uncharacterized protein n=1 Tax=Penicillium roqueforti (strain FM164) TaxID=1365484 RepID=W6QT90_PENRF|nr:unnamed protein product [Penicillium roqueforti FM164]